YTQILTVGTVSATSPAGGTISNVNTSTGAFDFDPPPGVTGNVTFTYTICDNGNPLPSLCSPPTLVTVNVAGPVIWFVNTSAPAGGTGRLSAPFNTLAAAGTAIGSNTGQRVFLYAGTYTTGRALNTGEWLIGQGVIGFANFDAVMGISPPSGTIARPSVGSGTATVQGTVTLNTNATVEGLAISTGTATGLTDPASAITGVSVNQTSVTTTTGTAVSLSDTAGTISLASVSSNGATPGITLTNTTGSFTVTGDGTTAGSGGTIQSSSTTAKAGIVLSNAASVSLNWMIIKNNPTEGINGSQVNGFTLANSTVSGNGTPANVSANNNDGLDFSPGSGTGSPNGLTGTATISNSTITGSADNNVTISDTSGSLNLTVTNSTISNNSTTNGNDGIHVDANDSASATVSITGTTFTNNRGDHFQFSTGAINTSAATGTNSVTFSSNTLNTTGPGVLGGGVTISPGGNAHTSITIDNNTITGAVDNGIGVDANGGTGTLSGTIHGNTIGTPSVAGSGSKGNDIGIFAEDSVTETLAITGNNLYHYANFAGLYYIDRQGNPTMNLTITGNTLADPDGTATQGGAWGILGEGGALTTDNGTVCAAITGNSLTGSGQTSLGSNDVELDQAGLVTYKLPGYTGGQYDTNAVQSFVSGNNNSGGTPNVLATTTNTGPGFTGGSSCPTPP
ncbi:MAG: right-handed parallel beta-helix repeat-containing protein, partial [Chloroflexi bacterium]|nr:right-handed parallel beta-helix repeat-containing protein [Chloroflexota bacterium]